MATQEKRPYEKPTLEPSSIFGADTNHRAAARPLERAAQRSARAWAKGQRTSTTS
jgi:hypothetical protein